MKTCFVNAVLLLLAAIRPHAARAEKAMPDFTLKGHAGRVVALAFSPDGSRLASASDDGRLKVWDVAAKKELFSIEGAGNFRNQLRFTPDGKTLVTLGSQDNVLVVDAATGKLRSAIAIANLPGGPAALDVSPDGTTIAIVGRSTLRLIDLATGAGKYEYEVHKLYAVASVAFSPDGARIATASTDNTALVIDIASGKIVRAFNLELKGEGVVFSRDGKALLTSASDQVLRSFNIETGQGKKLLDKGVPLVTLTLSKDGKTLVLAGTGRAPWLLSLPDGNLTSDAFDCEDRVMSASISPDGKWIAGGANEGDIYLWKADK
jgi:WD40 repeat protein